MNKLLSVIVAALFAVSTTAFVASPAGAQMKDEKKTEKKAKSDKKAAPKKDATKKAAPKKDAKKKDEMKK
jgi:Ni/Co efflux regulator RcnB